MVLLGVEHKLFPPMMRFVDWFFRDRHSGRIVIAQWPNLPLWIFAVLSVAEWITHPAGRLGLALHVATLLALAYWAGDELLRGVNPWRRCLGAAVLIGLAIRLFVWN